MLTIATCVLVLTILFLGKQVFAPKMEQKPIRIKKSEYTPSRKPKKPID